MHEDGTFPFTFDSWDGGLDGMVFEGVDWLEDFGPYKRGQRVEHLNIDYSQGIISEWTRDGICIRKMKFKAAFVEELPLDKEAPQVAPTS